jgi:hypothetical protein
LKCSDDDVLLSGPKETLAKVFILQGAVRIRRSIDTLIGLWVDNDRAMNERI